LLLDSGILCFLPVLATFLKWIEFADIQDQAHAHDHSLGSTYQDQVSGQGFAKPSLLNKHFKLEKLKLKRKQ
jgi:hypothetical protein